MRVGDRTLQTWYHEHKPSVAPHFRPYVAEALPTVWYKSFEKAGKASSMWSMWFIYFMHVEQLYSIYNNLGVYTGNKESCLSVNRREVGLHFGTKGPENPCRLLTEWKEEFVTFPKDTVRLHWDGSHTDTVRVHWDGSHRDTVRLHWDGSHMDTVRLH